MSWQKMCPVLFNKFSENKLRNIAKELDIPLYEKLNKRELCVELSLIVSKLKIENEIINGKCLNNETVINLTPISSLDPFVLYPIKEIQNKKEYIHCFDITELYDILQLNGTNPYTRKPFSKDQIKSINKHYKIYKLITNEYDKIPEKNPTPIQSRSNHIYNNEFFVEKQTYRNYFPSRSFLANGYEINTGLSETYRIIPYKTIYGIPRIVNLIGEDVVVFNEIYKQNIPSFLSPLY